MAGLSATYPQLLILRGVGGIGSAVFTIAATSLLLRLATSAQRGRTQSVYRSGFLIGGIVGPGFGGAVLGISLRAPFFLYAGTLLLAVVAAATLLPRARTLERRATPEPDAAPARTSLADALRTPAYQAALAGNFATGFSVLGVRNLVLPLLIVDGLGLAKGWVGAAFVVAAAVQTALLLPAGKAVDDLGRRPTLVAGAVLSTLALVALAFATGPVSLLLSIVLFAAGAALIGVAPAAIVGDVVEGRGGTAIAVWQMASDLGSVTGPLVAGYLIDRASFEVALLASAGIVAVCAALALRVPRVVRQA